MSGAAATEPSHDATSPSRCAHPPAAAGSCRTSTRTSSSPGALPPASFVAARPCEPRHRRRRRPGAPPPGRRPPRGPAPPGPRPSGSPADTRSSTVDQPSTQPRRWRPSSGPPGRSDPDPEPHVHRHPAGRPGPREPRRSCPDSAPCTAWATHELSETPCGGGRLLGLALDLLDQPQRDPADVAGVDPRAARRRGRRSRRRRRAPGRRRPGRRARRGAPRPSGRRARR